MEHFGAGAISGLVAAAATQPLEVWKTSRQVRSSNPRAIVAREGFRGMWRGMVPTALRATAGPALYFGFLPRWRGLVSTTPEQKNFRGGGFGVGTSAELFVAGALARGSAACLLAPITLAKARMEASGGEFGKVMRAAYVSGGASSLFRGLPATILRDMPFSGAYLAFYEGILKPRASSASRFTGDRISETSINAVFSFLAGAAATLATHPADVGGV